MKILVSKLLLIALVLFTLNGCDQLDRPEERITTLTIVLPNDYQGVFRVSPGSGPDALPQIRKMEDNVWQIPPGGDAVTPTVRPLADPTLKISIQYENGQALPNYGLGSPRTTDPGVFKLFTETSGANYWLIGTVEERNRAWAMGRDQLEMGKPLSEYEEEKAELAPLEF